MFVLRLLETREEKLFDPMPICKRKRHFITIDTSSLHGIARDAGIIKADCSSKTFLAVGEAHWASIFDAKRHLPKGGAFTGTIETDGVSVCIHYTRPILSTQRADVKEVSGKKKASSAVSTPTYKIDPEKTRVIGIDPGRSNLVFAAEVLPGGAIQTRRLTRKQYYREAGIMDARAQTLRWQRELKEPMEELSRVSSKGASLALYEEYLAVDLATGEYLWKENLKKRWARQRLRLYGGKKRVIASFYNQLTEACPGDVRPVVVAYGASKLVPGGRGEVSVPTSKVYKVCRERFETYAIDEFRTTRVDFRTRTVLGKVGRQVDGKTVRGLLWCGSTSQQKTSEFVNRDLNGAMNILKLLIDGPGRPDIMDRVKCRGQPLSDDVEKWIVC